ncbi:hypothetical protein JCM10207_009114 [Rhodosporidiobolus poonsookiae]
MAPSSSLSSELEKQQLDAPTAVVRTNLEKDDKGNVYVEEEHVVVDAVFGEISRGGPNYRGVHWIHATVLLIKTQIGLGVLGIPAVLTSLGLGPGLALIFIMGFITTWSGHVLHHFKLKHPEVYSMADVGYILGGVWGREILGAIYWLLLTSVAGASMLGFATALNNITDNAGCTAVWALVGAILIFLVSAIRTLERISWLSWVGLAGILGAVLTLAVAVGVQDRPDAAPQVGPWDPQVLVVAHPSFFDAMTALSTISFSFAGPPNFVSIVAEMRRPKDFTKSLIACQIVVTLTYAIIGAVVYHFCGVYVSSPALGSAGPLLKKVCYGIALPGLVIGGVLNVHLTSKYSFLRITLWLNKTEHVNSNSLKSWMFWLSFVLANVGIAYVIAEAIPFFGDLVSLIGALLATCIAITVWGWAWLHQNRERIMTERTPGLIALAIINVLLVALGAFIQVAGTIAAGKAIHASLLAGLAKPFSC